MKYFRAYNANRTIAGVRFEIVENFAGTMVGVFATDDQTLAARIAKEKAVQEISAQEYDDYLKKKAPHLREFAHSNKQPLKNLEPIKSHVTPAAKGAPLPDIEPQQTELQEGQPIADSADSVLEIGSVAPSPVGLESEEKPKRKRKQQSE